MTTTISTWRSYEMNTTASPGARKAPHTSTTAQPILVSQGDWFRLEVISKGSEIKVIANDVTTITFQEHSKDHELGHIALQAFTAETKLEVRKIEIRELAP